MQPPSVTPPPRGRLTVASGTAELEIEYPEHLSRLLIFVKWLLVIPHLLVLWVVGIGFAVVTFIAWFAILITGRYPQGMFEFVEGVLRWALRVNVYTYLMTDVYPPFSLE